jgi:predicted nucleic acid-binding protein
MELVDANVFLRFLTGDNPEQSARAGAYLESIERGDVVATTTEGVFVEIVHVLSSKVLYALPRAGIAFHLRTILGLSGLRLPNKRVYLRAADLYETTNLDFVDALNVAHMERLGIQTIVAFDRHYDRIPTVTRREP